MAVPGATRLPETDDQAGRREPFPIRWVRNLGRKGIRGIVEGRMYTARQWYRRKYFRVMGDRIKAYGLVFDLDNPLVTPDQKHYLRTEVHEADEVRMTRAHLDPALPAVELGGSMGVVACLTNKLLRHPERHVVVEANPLVVPMLEKNRAINGCQFEIMTAALAYGTPTVEFTLGPDAMTGAMNGSGSTKVQVPAVSLAEIVDSRGFEAINLVVDIEGAEIGLVENELELMKRRVKLFFLETHERMLEGDSTREMIAKLEGAGFRILEGDRDEPFVFAFINDALAGAGTPAS